MTSIHLTAADGSRLPPALAGQYLTLRMPGAGEPAPVRSYSLSSAPGADDYRISVKHEPHGVVSGYLRTLPVGTVLDVAAPRGDFLLDSDSDSGPVLLVSAGIGVTPVLAMLHELTARRSTRDVWWLHGARSPREHALAAEAHGLLTTLPHAREHVFYSAAATEECGRAGATAGHLTKQKLAELGLPAGATAYVCGPASFMEAMQQGLNAIGLDPARIHTELFGALAALDPGVVGRSDRSPHQPSGPPGTGPLVTFARSGVSTPFPSRGRSVLELADACDVPTRWSCRSGVCHTCITPLLAGDVSYSPDPLDPPPTGRC